MFLTVGCSGAAPEPMDDAPIPKVETRLAPRVVGDPQCGVTPQTLAWQNPFTNNPNTLPFYAPDGTIPVGGAVGGVTVSPAIWFEQRLWTLIGRSPSDPNATMNVHPSTAVGYTWNAIEAVPATGYTQTDFENLINAFANVDPVDATVPQCSYGLTANVAWDPTCESGLCDAYNWWTTITLSPTAPTGSSSATLPQ